MKDKYFDSTITAINHIKRMSDAHQLISELIIESNGAMEDEEIADRTNLPIDWVESVREELNQY